MPADRERLARQKGQPAFVQLHRALGRLTSVLTVMHTGAHPDDEQSGMLAALRFGFSMRIVIACSTRGEGGQNALGPERGGALGAMRTREMEEAARILDADVLWLGHGPDDPVHDFGFSKSGSDTLARWGRDRIVDRLVRAYRRERPDIVIPTFLDVPGQHGHHRAMTEAAETAVGLAVDPAYETPGLDPWQVAKFYLPAWPGGGGTYDDELPPPSPSVRIVAPGRDAPTGAAFDEIGEWSRTCHASQGMGRWKARPTTDWPLHLRLAPSGGETDIRDNLPADLAALAKRVDEPMAGNLRAAHEHIAQALRTFPDSRRIIEALLSAATRLEATLAAGAPRTLTLHRHRLERKLAEIDTALLLAGGVRAVAWTDPGQAPPGRTAALRMRIIPGDDGTVTAKPITRTAIAVGAPELNEGIVTHRLDVAGGAPLTPAFAPGWSSMGGNGELVVKLEAVIGGRTVRTLLDLEEPFTVIPAHAVELSPEAFILASGGTPAPLEVAISGSSDPAAIAIELPAGWRAQRTAAGQILMPPAGLADGTYRMPVLAGGQPTHRQTSIVYPHIGHTRYAERASVDVLALDLTLPEGARVGYVGGGSDRVGVWLGRMGIDVTELDERALNGNLSGYTSIVVGIFAFGVRRDLAAATARLHRWVEDGGHLLTLYHRPTDGWDPDATPPRRLLIGSPSLRWRVTNPDAAVEVLAPDHPLLAGPNRIGPQDWAGWDKERGLYFASEWAPAYRPLLAMQDAGEAPLAGALLSARIGRGWHTHTGLVLHHQLDRLVPGAFRLMANLVQPA